MNVNVVSHIRLPFGAYVAGNAYNFTESYYRELKKILKIKRVENIPFVRIGKNNDGGYAMIDNFENNNRGGLLTLSESAMMYLGIWIWLNAVLIFLCTI